MFFYTPGGKGDPANDPYGNQIMVTTLPPMKNEAIKKYAQGMIVQYQQSGMEISSATQKEIILNGNYAYEISFRNSYKGKTGLVYQVVTGDSSSAVLFLGSVYDNHDDLMSQVKNIAKTLRPK